MDVCIACTECLLYFVSERGSCRRVHFLCDKVALFRDGDALYALVL